MRLRQDACRGAPGRRAGFLALSIGPRLRALAVYLVVFQHVPVERCRELIADVTGAVVSEGFIHSCLAKAASLAADVVRLIRTLIAAAGVAGFDETTLRSGPAGRRVLRVHRGVFGVSGPGQPEPGFHAGRRDLAGPSPAIVVSDRYRELLPPPVGARRREPGMPVSPAQGLRGLRREHTRARIWPAQAQRALRGLIHAWHAAREQGLAAIPG